MKTRSWLLALVVATAGACGDGGGFPDAPLPDSAVPGGTLSVAWSLTDAMGNPITCARIGAQTVTLVLRNRDVSGASTEVFTCSSGEGTTPKVAPGTYDVSFELQHGSFGLIAQATTQLGVVVESNQNTQLAPVTFAVDATGGVELKLDASMATNCASPGADIDGITITLTKAPNATCAPITFTISGNPAREYTVNCANPMVTACIEKDQTITASGISSEPYRIRVRGRVGGVECFASDDTLNVPPAGNVLMRTLFLGPTGGC